MLFSFSWLCRAAQGHNPSWRGAQERYPRWAAQGHNPSWRGAQERYPRRAAQEHNPSRRGAQGRYPRRAARKGAHTAYIISYFLLKYHCFFTKTRRFFAARPAKRKKHAPAQEKRPSSPQTNRHAQINPFPQRKRPPSPRAASLWGGGWRANPASRKVRARRRATRGAFPQKRAPPPKKKARPRPKRTGAPK